MTSDPEDDYPIAPPPSGHQQEYLAQQEALTGSIPAITADLLAEADAANAPGAPPEKQGGAAGASDSSDSKASGGPTHEAPVHSQSYRAMPLLDLITRQSLDADYALVAQRPKSDSPTRARTASIVVVVVVALLLTVAALEASRDADVSALGRASLVERIQNEKSDVARLQEQVGLLRDDNLELEEQARRLRAEEADVTTRVSRVGARTGYLAVTGPGLRITVDDGAGDSAAQAVRDSDLILLVDGLWNAGAEAIAINGQRLTSLSSIQNSGQAIHVNVRPLSPPYQVEAIGNPDRLHGDLLATTSGIAFYGVARNVGLVVSVKDVERLNLPAARVRTLKYAEPLDPDDERKDAP